MVSTACLASYGFASAPAAGQVVWGPWLTEDTSQCQCRGCSVAVNPPPECEAVAAECQRRDSEISVTAGRNEFSDSDSIGCTFCPLCCADPPCSCSGGATSISCGIAGVTEKESWTFLPASCLGSDTAAIGISLRDAVGFTDAEVTQDCLAQAVRCTSTDTKARITVERGRSATRKHEWRFRMVYTDADGKTCPIPGEHVRECGLDESQVTADILAAGCGSCVVDTTPCGPGCP